MKGNCETLDEYNALNEWIIVGNLINSIPVALILTDDKNMIVFANDAAKKLLGEIGTSVEGKRLPEVLNLPGTSLGGVQKGSELEIINGDKTLLVNRLKVNEPSPNASLWMISDSSEINQLKRNLKEEKKLNAELEAIINCSYDGIWVTDGNGTVVRLNKASEVFSERKASELIGRNMRDLVKEGFLDKSATLLVMEKKQQITITQTVAGKRKLLATGTPIFDEEGNIYRIVTNVRDVTDLYRLQNELNRERELSLKYQSELTHLRTMHISGSDLVYRSESMAQIVQLVSRIAHVDSTVLITGESGSGKEMIAKLIHRLGKGYNKPLITVNCSAIPESLMESELFGYEGGAFTGAKKDGKPGMFELAHTGTLFLDEIGDLPMGIQTKLLRVIESKEVFRVGGTKSIPVEVRIIAATNRDLNSMVKSRAFREDLYYRLMVVPIHVPPLRERKDDIPILVYYFMDEFNHHFGLWKKIRPDTIDALMEYDWPGNVRELRNVIERMVVTTPGEEITPDDLPIHLKVKRYLPKIGTKLKEAVAETEAYLILEAYRKSGSWVKAAKLLGVNFSTIYRKARKYRLISD